MRHDQQADYGSLDRKQNLLELINVGLDKSVKNQDDDGNKTRSKMKYHYDNDGNGNGNGNGNDDRNNRVINAVPSRHMGVGIVIMILLFTFTVVIGVMKITMIQPVVLSHDNNSNNKSIFISKTKPTTIVEEKSRTTKFPEFPSWPEFHWKRIAQDDPTSFIGYLRLCKSNNTTANHSSLFVYRSVDSAAISMNDPCSGDENDFKEQPSPLIRMNPGNAYTIVLINHSDQPTNLHTHGLHVPGIGPYDDITRNVDPGNCLVYQYQILDDADIGTFWYHSHRHPIASHQVSNGAYGMLLIEESREQRQQHVYPSSLQKFFDPNRQVILQYTCVRTSTTSSTTKKGTTKKKIRTRTNWINGQKSPIHLTWTKSTWYYVRISAVVISDPINFVQIDPPTACEARVIAYDGVYRSKIPHEIPNHIHMLSSSSRVDLAIKCIHDANIYFHQNQTNPLSSLSRLVYLHVEDKHVASAADDDDDDVVASPYWDAITQTQWEPRKPYYMPYYSLHDSSTMTTNNNTIEVWNISMDNFQNDDTKEKFVAINRHVWDPNTPIRSFPLNHIVEFALYGTERHPFHVHINHMQIVSKGGCGHRYEEGEFYDTISAADSSSQQRPCHVRLQFWDYIGRVIVHCHKLRHEDRGMMVWLNITSKAELESDSDGNNSTITTRSGPTEFQGRSQESCTSL